MLASPLTASHWRPCISSCDSDDVNGMTDYPCSRQGLSQHGISTGMSLELQPSHGNGYGDACSSDAALGQAYLQSAAPTFGSPVSAQSPQHLAAHPPVHRDQLDDVLDPPPTPPRPPSACQSPPQDGARSSTSCNPTPLDTDPESSPPAQRNPFRPTHPDGETTAAPRPDGADPLCDVCGEAASGHYFGALVCLPCKSFFIRCTKNGEPTFSSQCGGNCDILKLGRIRCQFCRFQRCLSAGMYRKEKPEAVVPAEGQTLCKVCCDLANGVHFGVTTCEGCKKFFRRGLKEHHGYVCKAFRKCTINPRMRNNCRYCRFQKCLNVGMSRDAIKMGRPKKDGNAVCRQDELQNNLEEKQAPSRSTVGAFPVSYPDLQPVVGSAGQGGVSSEATSAQEDLGGNGCQDPSRLEHELGVETYESSSFSDDFLAAVSMDMRTPPSPASKLPTSDSDMTSSARNVSCVAPVAALGHVTASVGSESVGDDSSTSGSWPLMSEGASPVHATDFFQTRVQFPARPLCRTQDVSFSPSTPYTTSENLRFCLSPELEGSLYGHEEQDRKLQASFLARPTFHHTGPLHLSPACRHDHIRQGNLPTTYPDPGYSCPGDVTPQLATPAGSVPRTLIQNLSVCVQRNSLAREHAGSEWLPGLLCGYNQPHRYDSQQRRDHGQSAALYRPTCTLEYYQHNNAKCFRYTSLPARETNEAGSRSCWPGAGRGKRDAQPSASPCDLHGWVDMIAERPSTASGTATTSGKLAASPSAFDIPQVPEPSHDPDSQPVTDCLVGNACGNPFLTLGPDLSSVHRPLREVDTADWFSCPAPRRRSGSPLNCPANIKRWRWADQSQDHNAVAQPNGQVEDVAQGEVSQQEDDTVLLSTFASRSASTGGWSLGQKHVSYHDRSKLSEIFVLDSELTGDERCLARKNKASGLARRTHFDHQQAAPVAELTANNEHLSMTDTDSQTREHAPEGCGAAVTCDKQQDSKREFESRNTHNDGRRCSRRARRKTLEKHAKKSKDCIDGIRTCELENADPTVSTATDPRVHDGKTSGSRVTEGDKSICGNDGVADDNCDVRLGSAGGVQTSSPADTPLLSVTVDSGGLLDVDRHFLATDNSCEASDCRCNSVGSPFGSQDAQRDTCQCPGWPRQRSISSSTCPVTHPSSCDQLPGRPRRRQSWQAFSPSHARDHWHQHTWAGSSPLNTDSMHTLQAVVRAVAHLREVLGDPDLNELVDQMVDHSVEPLVQMCRLKVTMTQASGHFLAQLPGCQKLTSADQRLLSQEGGFGPVFLLTTFLAHDADIKAFRQMWNWVVPVQSPLFAFKVHLLRVADHLREVGPDVMEVALLCALCLLRTDIEGIRDKLIIQNLKETVRGALEVHLAANGQLPSSRLRKLLSVMAGVNFVTAWFNSLVPDIACSS